MTPPTSLSELIAAVHPRLLRLARQLLPPRLRSKLTEEDVVASVYKSWLKNYGPDSAHLFNENGFWYLLACMVRRKVVDKQRRYGAAKRSVDREVPILQDDRVGGDPTAPQEANEVEIDDAIGALLKELTPEAREVVILREIEGLTADEVAERLNLTRHQVNRRHRAALEQLRAACAPGES